LPSKVFQSRRRLPLAIALAMGAGGADAATITVTAGGDGGTSATCTLRQAIAVVEATATSNTGCVSSGAAFGSNDTIVFDAVAVPSASVITLSEGELRVVSLAAPLTIQGSGQTIDAGSLSRVLYAKWTTLTVSSLTLTGGRAANYGGGEYVILSYGGGVYAASSTVTLTNSTVAGNSAVNQGGGVWAKNSTVTLTDSSVSGNYASNPYLLSKGGGVYASGSTLTLTSSSVSGNSAFAGGGVYASSGGAYGSGGTLTLNNSTVSGNSAAFGGGVSADTVTLINSTVSGNFAGQHGGGVSANVVTVNNSTVSGNSAEYEGGVIAGDATLTNTILCGNTSANGDPDLVVWSAIPASATYSLLGTALDTLPYSDSGNHNIFSDSPGLGALAGNGGPTQTMALLSGSPAINAGSDALIPVDTPYDQRGAGYPRIVDGTVDIGAFELHDWIFANDFDFGP